MADAPALGAGAAKAACRFDPDLAYQIVRYANRVEAPGRCFVDAGLSYHPPVSTRSRTMARRLLDANEALIEFVAGLSDEQWRAACPREGRTVGEVVLHVAAGHRIIGGITEAIAKGTPLPPAARRTVETGARFNARQTLSFAGRTRDDGLRLLRQNGRACAAMIEQLTDDELDRTVSTADGPLSAEAEIEGGLLGHLDRHLTAAREALSPEPHTRVMEADQPRPQALPRTIDRRHPGRPRG